MERIERMEELEDFDLGMDDFVDTTTKVPVKFVMDISESMGWSGGIDSMWAGTNVFLDALKSNDTASASVEVSISTFNHEVQEVIPFSPLDDIKKVDKFKANGLTDIAKALNQALDDVEARKNYYKQNNIRHKAPWIILLTDGYINPEEINEVVQRTNSLIQARKLTMFVIGVGNDINIEQLKRFDVSKPVIFSPEQEDLVPLFEWLSSTATGYSQTGSGEKYQTEELDRRYELIG